MARYAQAKWGMDLGRRAMLTFLAASAPWPALALGPVWPLAAHREAASLIVTGSATRVRKVAFLRFSLWDITHAMRELPRAPSRAAVIGMDVDKVFSHTMLREIESDLFCNDFRRGYRVNGFHGDARIQSFLRPVEGTLRPGAIVTIRYHAARQRTTLSVQGGSRAIIDGTDFMRATWSVWLGISDQPGLGDALIARIAGGKS